MAYPSLRGSATTADIAQSASTATVNKPTGVAAGDLLVVVFNVNNLSVNDGSFSTWSLSGWAQSVGQVGTAANWSKTFALKRVADGSEGSSFVFTRDTSPLDIAVDDSVIVCLAFSGASDVGATASSAAGTPTTSWSSPDLTTTQAESLVLRAWSTDCQANVNGATLGSYTAGLTELVDFHHSTNGSWNWLALTTEEQATAAATGTKSATSSVSAGWIMLALEIKASGGSPPPTYNVDVPPEALLHEGGLSNTALRDVRAWL